ncbi:O-linked N-acetylglucosamine transferase, SPINDLY family protein [Halomonas sp.]|uniref:O-linked N-acetylglucosamine transferase, SPINDLY family protein n=2 Tax=Halomonas sp. TaxID=1486246 RepID=UPI003F97E556
MSKKTSASMPKKARQNSVTGKSVPSSLHKAKKLAERQPQNAAAWKQLGAELSEAGLRQEALEALDKALMLTPNDAEALAVKGRITHQLGDPEQGLALLKEAVKRQPGFAKAQHYIGYIYYTQARYDDALTYADEACRLAPNDVDMLNTLGNVLMQKFEYSRAQKTLEKAAQLAPNNYLSWNNLGNVYNAVGDLDKGLDAYQQAHRINPQAPGPFSNIITTCHYHPHKTAEEITGLCKQWDNKFSVQTTIKSYDNLVDPQKQLRIGLISDGFRGHPVGRMITSALENVSKAQIALYLYSTNNAIDGITQRLQAASEKWMSIQPLNDEQVAEQVASDKIDILIDLAGHNAGNRVLAVSRRPAPLQVKWVGGLINTTGLSAIDYLISDSVETPEGVDEEYVEKLIRLPNDYICYVPPGGYEPEVGPLPARQNGYLTLGCFNNATKLNDVVLEQWAKLMDALPNSKLMLKSMQYKSEERCQKIRETMALHGIESSRLIIEGPSSHAELLDAYNKIDISLDPWPYSGGLTTCESFLMGVPVVTLPGPTFAGRHSATHLVNAGMPELVVTCWEEYKARVIDLASDLDSLAAIRQHLRQILLASPVCNAPLFAGHFTDAMRAIWQRHCEGKPPAALTFDKAGQATFKDESVPVEVAYAIENEAASNDFSWSLPSKIITLDNGAALLRQQGVEGLRQLKAFGIVAFDPASHVQNADQFQGSDDIQVFPHTALGDGKPATLYACLDETLSSTLEPLPEPTGNEALATQVLAKLPISTITLDSIEGLESLDWLILDGLNDAVAILENGEASLSETLAIQVRIAFQPTHYRQPNLAEIQHWMSRHGFRFYRFNNTQHTSQLPDSVPSALRQATELQSADALFLPSHARMSTLSDQQRIKLAFLLHTVYGIKDMAYHQLFCVDKEKAEQYLVSNGLSESSERYDAANKKENQSNTNNNTFDVPDAPFMTEAERLFFKKALKGATHYFEYGSGGSTVWAVNEGLEVRGVESDAKWVDALKNKLGHKCQVMPVDIGFTKEWGYPASLAEAHKFENYK